MNPNPYSDNYWEGPPALRNPTSARQAHAAYLLGLGPMPPLRPEERATALFNAQLNSGAFSGTGNTVYDDVPGKLLLAITD
jgi:hypothetical protein